MSEGNRSESMIRRNSKQRQLILETVKGLRTHPTAEEIFQLVREQNPNISLGTVYRNLNLLSEMGEILKLDLGVGSEHFDGMNQEHGHLVCSNCGCIEDLSCDLSESIRVMMENKLDRHMDAIYLTVCGLCKNCSSGHTNN